MLVGLFLSGWVLPATDLHAQTATCSTQFRLGGQGQKPRTYTFEGLRQFPSTQANVTFSAGNTPRVSAAYTGVLFWDLPVQAQVTTDPAAKNDLLRHYVVVTGSDGCQTVLSLGELSPDFGGQQVLVAYAQNGPLLDANTGGFARLIVPGDKAGGRSVSNLVSVKVRLGSRPATTADPQGASDRSSNTV